MEQGAALRTTSGSPENSVILVDSLQQSSYLKALETLNA
jgi:hypothetical protein